MAGNKGQSNGRLAEAMETLLQSQAILVQNQAAFLAQARETDRLLLQFQRENSERFARIETILLEHSRTLADHGRILADHSRILQAMPDEIGRKIGFKPPEKP